MVDNESNEMSYLDLQAVAGVTKHPGGFDATNELLSMCRVEHAQEVLEVGCGIGVGPAYIAKNYGCRVVGVDISEKMIEWSELRAKQEGVEGLVDFRVADVSDLPFESDRFDIARCESVLAFVEDKAKAIRELKRVVKPGGYVGLNEVFWFEEPPPDFADKAVSLGTDVLTEDEWRSLWKQIGFSSQQIKTYVHDTRKEVKDRINWISWRWILRAWGRLIPMYFKTPSLRKIIKEQFDAPTEILELLGYGLFVGRK